MQAVPFIVAGVAAAGQAVSAYKKSKYHTRQAAEDLEAKNRRMAAATREAQEERRKAEFLQSRARAVAAASGGGTDAGMVKQFADLAAEGEYRVLSRVWQGQNDAEGLIASAEANYKAAKDAKVMGMINTVTTAFSTYMMAGGTFGAPANAPVGPTGISSQGLPYSPTTVNAPSVSLWKGP
jgi:DNA polymerase II small subunit/DNA polymerase delta subunit B